MNGSFWVLFLTFCNTLHYLATTKPKIYQFWNVTQPARPLILLPTLSTKIIACKMKQQADVERVCFYWLILVKIKPQFMVSYNYLLDTAIGQFYAAGMQTRQNHIKTNLT